ncbi:MAG: LytR C-terminal domain-containing protein [Haloechinothrix sp.]
MSFADLSRPMRAAGFALLGIAVVATVIGTASAISGDGPSQSAEPAETAPGEPAPGRTTTGQDAPGTGEGPAPTTGDAPTTTEPEGVPGTSYPTGRPDENGGESTKAPRPGGTDKTQAADPAHSVPVRVYNNSTVRDLAALAADDLKSEGWKVVDVGNYSDGIIPTTTAYYRPGTDEEAAARAIAEAFGMRVEPRFDGIKDSSAGVIVIVTKDYQGESGGKY